VPALLAAPAGLGSSAAAPSLPAPAPMLHSRSGTHGHPPYFRLIGQARSPQPNSKARQIFGPLQ